MLAGLLRRAFQVMGGGNAAAQDEHLQLGLRHARLGEMDQAARCFEALLRLDPNSVAGHMNLGNIAFSQGRLGDACRHYEAALAASGLPRHGAANADLANNLGIALMRQGLPDEAVACFQDVLRERETAEAARIQLDQVKSIYCIVSIISPGLYKCNNLISGLQKLSA